MPPLALRDRPPRPSGRPRCRGVGRPSRVPFLPCLVRWGGGEPVNRGPSIHRTPGTLWAGCHGCKRPKSGHMQGFCAKKCPYAGLFGLSLLAGFYAKKCPFAGVFGALRGRGRGGATTQRRGRCEHMFPPTANTCGRKYPPTPATTSTATGSPYGFPLHMGTFSKNPCIRGTYKNPLLAGKTCENPYGAFSGDSRG